jgi:2-iminobutanoate/2-iminopropanoate deaminase
MKKTVITSDEAPPAVGPYSQAVAAGPFVFVSGQIPLDTQGQLVRGDIVVQTARFWRISRQYWRLPVWASRMW